MTPTAPTNDPNSPNAPNQHFQPTTPTSPSSPPISLLTPPPPMPSPHPQLPPNSPPSPSAPYDVQLQEVPQPRGALHAHQDGVALLGAEAQGQAVGAGAGPVIGGPRVGDESPPLAEDVGGAGCRETATGYGGGQWGGDAGNGGSGE